MLKFILLGLFLFQTTEKAKEVKPKDSKDANPVFNFTYNNPYAWTDMNLIRVKDAFGGELTVKQQIINKTYQVTIEDNKNIWRCYALSAEVHIVNITCTRPYERIPEE